MSYLIDTLRASTATYDKYGPSNGRRCSRARPGAVTGHASNFTSCIRTSHTRFLSIQRHAKEVEPTYYVDHLATRRRRCRRSPCPAPAAWAAAAAPAPPVPPAAPLRPPPPPMAAIEALTAQLLLGIQREKLGLFCDYRVRVFSNFLFVFVSPIARISTM